MNPCHRATLAYWRLNICTCICGLANREWFSNFQHFCDANTYDKFGPAVAMQMLLAHWCYMTASVFGLVMCLLPEETHEVDDDDVLEIGGLADVAHACCLINPID